MPRRSKQQMKYVTNMVISDLIMGLPQNVIAEKRKISRQAVCYIANKYSDKIEEGHNKHQQKEQEKVDEFLEGETQTFIRVCQMASENLEWAMKEFSKKRESKDKRVPTKYKYTEDGMEVEARPIDDVKEALFVFKEIHEMLRKYQKDAED